MNTTLLASVLSLLALSGRISTESGLGLPERLEPELHVVQGTKSARGGMVALTVTLRDAKQSSLGDWQVGALVVEEPGTSLAPVTIPLSSFHELERTLGPGEKTAVCRRWKGESCAGFAALSSTTEWDGTTFYTVRQATSAGARVTLNLRLQLTRTTSIGGSAITLTRELTNTVVVTVRADHRPTRW